MREHQVRGSLPMDFVAGFLHGLFPSPALPASIARIRIVASAPPWLLADTIRLTSLDFSLSLARTRRCGKRRRPPLRTSGKVMSLLSIFRGRRPIRDLDGIAQFVDENAAFVMQKG